MEKIKLASVKFKSAGKVYYFSTDIELDKGDKVAYRSKFFNRLKPINKELPVKNW